MNVSVVVKRIKSSSMLQGILISLFFTFIFIYSFFFNIQTPIESVHSDTFHVTITLKHYMDTVFNNDWGNILQVPMFYGFKDTLLYSELFIMEAMMALPIYAIFKDIIITYNILAIVTIWFSFFSMFVFVKYATNRTLPAILAAIIFVFNPFVIGHFPDNLHYFSLGWIPLIFLFLEKSFIKPNNKNEFLFFFFLTCQLLTTLTFGALLTVVLPVYVLIRVWQLKLVKNFSDIKKFITIGAILGVLLFTLTTFGISKTYDLYFHDKGLGRNLEETSAFSPWVSDLFFTSPNNILYGGLRDWAKENMTYVVFQHPEFIERNLFFGITVWILLILSFFVLRKSKYRKIWIAYVACGLISVILSFGPDIRISSETAIPGLYGLIHKFHPLLQSLRVASRFMVLAFFFFGLICALSLIEIEKYFNKKTGIIISLMLITFITLEYSSWPWKFTPISSEVRNYYSVLNNQRDINAILEFPMGNLFRNIGFAENQFIETKYMLWASALHNKKLLNGYSSYTPVSYPARIEYLTVNFPTPGKINQLRKWGIDAISLHKNEFMDPADYNTIKRKLSLLGLHKIEETPSMALFKIN